MFGIPSFAAPTVDFLTLMEARVGALFDEHGIKRATDSTGGSTSAGMFSMLADLEPPGEAYDDRPAIEKLIAAVASAAKKARTSRTASFRLLGCHPTTCAVMIMVVGTFTPVSSDQSTDIDRLSRWSLSLRCRVRPDAPATLRSSERLHYDGDVMDAATLHTAIETLRGMCHYLRTEHQLEPVRSPSYADAPLGAFVSGAPPSVVTEQ